MCEKCNEALLTAATAAKDLASAAFTLHQMNATREADVLAKAAAELFEPAPKLAGEGLAAGSAAAEGDKPGTGKTEEKGWRAQVLNQLRGTLSGDVTINENGEIVLDGNVVGQAYVVRR